MHWLGLGEEDDEDVDDSDASDHSDGSGVDNLRARTVQPAASDPAQVARSVIKQPAAEEAPSAGQEQDESWVTVQNKRKPTRSSPSHQATGGYPVGPPFAYGGKGSSRSSTAPLSSAHEKAIVEQRSVLVYGLTAKVTEADLRKAFAHCGDIDEAEVECDSAGMSRGLGYVVFKDAESAAMASKDGGPRLDGKLTEVRFERPRERKSIYKMDKAKKQEEDANTQQARRELQELLHVRELVGSTGYVLSMAEPKAALRAIRGIEACNGDGGALPESLLMSELQKAIGNQLTKKLENDVQLWVHNLKLTESWKKRVEAVVLAQRPSEIEHILEMGERASFQLELCSKDNPCQWILWQTQRFRRQRTLDDINAFCKRFEFGSRVKQDLSDLSAERARRLMRQWRPTGGSMEEHQAEFQVLLAQATTERRRYLQQRKRQPLSAVSTHARILRGYVDEGDDDDDEDPGVGPGVEIRRNPAASSSSAPAEDLYTFDANIEADFAKDKKSKEASTGDAASSSSQEPFRQQGQETATQKTPRTSMSTAAAAGDKPKRWKPLATHFILCVDTSGSMATPDCTGPDGEYLSRLEAVRATCDEFVTQSTLNNGDVYSFVAFNEHCVLHFSRLPAVQACTQLRDLELSTSGRTFYARGIQGIEVAMKQVRNKQPTHVVFLSDGEPSDPNTYLQELQKLVRATSCPLRIYTVGFGQTAKVTQDEEEDFMFLQQLAQLGRGHFQKAGASLSSLKGAFTALTSTISGRRSSCSVASLRRSAIERINSGRSAEATSMMSMTYVDADPTRNTAILHPTIDEANESDEFSSEGDIEEQTQKLAGLGLTPEQAELEALLHQQRLCPNVSFEKPDPGAIWKDTHNSALWRSFTAAETSFTFDGKTFSQSVGVHKVFLRQRPFMMGGMRLVYGMVKEQGAIDPSNPNHMMCGKICFQDLMQDTGFRAHKNFSRCTAVAQYYAKVFRKKTGVPKFGFLDCHVYSPINSTESGQHFCGEAWMKGHFVKLNSNNGFVNEAEFASHSELAQAFSHFTFDYSHGELMVVDLQGVCGGSDKDLYFCLTDPQVHSRGTYERFGHGDLGDRGIRAFFSKHVCNDVCRKLKLRQENHLCEPTHIHPMPGVKGCITHMLGPGVTEFFSHIKNHCGVTSITVPREPHSDWVEIKIWGSRKGGEKAKALLQARLEEYYLLARTTVDMPGRIPWSTEKWENKIEGWKRESGAPVVAFPPDWRESGVVELWTFAQRRMDDRYDHRLATVASNMINEWLLEIPADATAAPSQPAATANAAAAPAAGANESGEPLWQKYLDEERDKLYWYRSTDGCWFYEGQHPWQQFLDGSRLWWFNSETSDWFYEPDATAAGGA